MCQDFVSDEVRFNTNYEKGRNVKQLTVFLLAFLALLAGCTSVRWAELDDNSLAGRSGSELTLLEDALASAILFEDFNDPDFAEGARISDATRIEEGAIRLLGDGTRVEVCLPAEATRIIACYRFEAPTGRLGMTTYLAEGRTEIFENILGTWAHNMDRLTPYHRVNGPGYGNRGEPEWTVQEMRIERNRLQFYTNGRRFGSVKLEESTGFRSFSVVAEDEGYGTLDWILAI